MQIPRIPSASRIDHPGELARRSPSARRFDLERLEARTALSSGLHASLAAMDSYRVEVAPAIIGSVEAASTAQEAGVAGAGAAPAVSRTGILEAPDIQLLAATPLTGESSPPVPSAYTNLLPLASDLLDGLAGSIAILGQAYRDGVPISVLLDGFATAVGATPAEIPPALIAVGEAAVFTAQAAGIRRRAGDRQPAPTARPRKANSRGGSPPPSGQIEALAAVDGSTPPDQASIAGLPPTVSTFVRGEVAYVGPPQSPRGDPGPPGPGPNDATGTPRSDFPR